MTDRPLGRRAPADWKHVERYSLTPATAPSTPTPVVIGVNWYEAFDMPEREGRDFWIGRAGLGSVRGGHAIALEPRGTTAARDTTRWWSFYNQQAEGACVGHACSRMMSLLNRSRYDARWLYREAQLIDEWTDTPPGEGTSVRAACDILRDRGHRLIGRGGKSKPEASSHGIRANRWATRVEEVLEVLGTPGLDHVVLLNSWGRVYPHRVKMPCETLGRLIAEDGEVALVVDR